MVGFDSFSRILLKNLYIMKIEINMFKKKNSINNTFFC